MNKNILLLLSVLTLFISSCKTIKTVNKNTSKEIEKTPVVIKTTATVKTPDVAKTTKVFNHSAWNDLLQKHVFRNGNVDYKGFITDSESFEAYLNSLSENEPQNSWTKAEKFAYWINAYNAFTVKLIIDNYPIKSIKDIVKPWDKKFILIGNDLVSLNHIEHKILRKMDEPRIHFAIVCASVSCPKLQNIAFDAVNLESQLTNATKEFLEDSTRNNFSENSIEISKIFKWFASDFKQDGSLIDFLNTYSEITISQKASKRFMDYDWDLNE